MERENNTAQSEELEAFIRQSEKDFYNVTFAFCNDAALTEDAMQEAYRRFLSSEPGKQDIFRWLVTTSRNYIRTYQSDPRRKERSIVNSRANPALVQTSGPQQEAQQREEQRIFNALIEKLPEEDRTALKLRIHDGLSSKEIASRMESTEDGVNMRLSRIRKKLKEGYEKSMWL